jgi:hypothetical protein
VGLGDDIRVVTRNTSYPMRSGTWFGRFWTRLTAEVIQDVPASLEECEACREVSCTQERWLTCARRLAAEAERNHTADHAMPAVTGRSDEMPGVYAADDLQDQSTENETAESGDQRKRISSSGD